MGGVSKHAGRCEAWCITTAGAASLWSADKAPDQEGSICFGSWLKGVYSPSWQGRHCSGSMGQLVARPQVLSREAGIDETWCSHFQVFYLLPRTPAHTVLLLNLGGLLPHGPLPGYALMDMSKIVTD